MTSKTKLPRGVSYDKAGRCYKARIGHKGKTVNLGRFQTVEDAAAAYAAGVEKYGQPVFGKLTAEQEAKRDANYRAWRDSQRTFVDYVREQIGLYDPERPWSVGVSVEDDTGRTFRLTGYGREQSVFGDECWVAHFDTPCEIKGCARSARTYQWTHRDPLKKFALRCDEHDGGRTAHFAADRAVLATVWNAVFQSMGYDRSVEAMPEDMRAEGQSRANTLRPVLRALLDLMYDDVADVPEDWWEGVF